MAQPIIPKRRLITEKNNLIEIVAWRVPKSKSYPEGIKYSFTFVHDDKRVIAFDNFNNEDHHRHYLDKKEKYHFKSLEDTANQFFTLVEKWEEINGKGDEK